MRIPVTFGAIIALVLVTGCGGGSSNPTTAPTAAATGITCSASGEGSAVAIANFSFNPASGNAATGGFVTWSNTDSTNHTVTFDNGPDCGVVAGGTSQTVQFTLAGTFAYHCRIHPSMKGSIVVS